MIPDPNSTHVVTPPNFSYTKKNVQSKTPSHENLQNTETMTRDQNEDLSDSDKFQVGAASIPGRPLEPDTHACSPLINSYHLYSKLFIVVCCSLSSSNLGTTEFQFYSNVSHFEHT